MSGAVWMLTAAVFAPLALGLITLALPRAAIAGRTLVALLGPVISIALLGLYVARFGLDSHTVGVEWMPALRMNLGFLADRLGIFFAFLISGIGLLITVYARGYFGADRDSLFRFFPTLHLFMTAMLGLVLADSTMLLLLFWEMTSVSSFLLIGWNHDEKESVKKALQAFVVTAAGGLALMAGLILLGAHTGIWTFSEILRGPIPSDATTRAALGLIFAGAAVKSAQWPLHFWLPGAMVAPTPVSAYLHSATMVKAGVYLAGRLWPAFAVAFPQTWPALLVTFGAITMVLGAYVALRRNDLKQIFAYTTVSQLGLLMAAYGLASFRFEGEANLIWDVTQVLNHALYKAPLFLAAGAIDHLVHTRELPELRGLFHRGRDGAILSLVVILGAYAMAAGPFTLSFPAKEFFFYAIHHGHEASGHPIFYALMLAGVLTGAFNAAIFLRMTRILLAGGLARRGSATSHGEDSRRASSPAKKHAWDTALWLPALVLIALQFLGGIWPGGFEKIFGPLEATRAYFDHIPTTLHLLTHPGLPLYLSLAGFALGIVIAFAPVLRPVIRDFHDAIFPAFYTACTRGGAWLFGLVQTGNLRNYVALTWATLVALIVWSAEFAPPGPAILEPWRALLPGYLMALLVCGSALLMPLVRDRASRILVLGTAGFSVTALFYLYQAPDLALTQISIEIVSLVLFLLVLSMLPKESPPELVRVPTRIMLALAVGAAMFWVTLSSATAPRVPLAHRNADGKSFSHLGEFFIRNSRHAVDVSHHPGGGGDNVVNVILVDFRGFDTLGEITVLGLAALGVWTLLRRRRRQQDTHALRRNISEVTPAPEALTSGSEAAS